MKSKEFINEGPFQDAVAKGKTYASNIKSAAATAASDLNDALPPDTANLAGRGVLKGMGFTPGQKKSFDNRQPPQPEQQEPQRALPNPNKVPVVVDPTMSPAQRQHAIPTRAAKFKAIIAIVWRWCMCANRRCNKSSDTRNRRASSTGWSIGRRHWVGRRAG